MPRGNELKKIPEIQKAIVNVLEYFDFFQHSLYPDEIHKYLSLKACKEASLTSKLLWANVSLKILYISALNLLRCSMI